MRKARNKLLDTFHLFDQSRKGNITIQDLQRVAREIYCTGDGVGINFRRMIDLFDKDKDGCINFDEFQTIMRESYIS